MAQKFHHGIDAMSFPLKRQTLPMVNRSSLCMSTVQQHPGNFLQTLKLRNGDVFVWTYLLPAIFFMDSLGVSFPWTTPGLHSELYKTYIDIICERVQPRVTSFVIYLWDVMNSMDPNLFIRTGHASSRLKKPMAAPNIKNELWDAMRFYCKGIQGFAVYVANI